MDIIHQNGGFKSSTGFILACIGSAVGMGTIWMFPYRLGEYGGGAFLIPYILFSILFGLVGLSAEFAIGRRAKTGTLGAYEYCWSKIKQSKLGYCLGWIPLLGSLGIAIGYAIIIGWVLRALWWSITGEMLSGHHEVFLQEVTGEFGSVFWHTLVIVMTALILMFGSTSGIEKVNKILMPLFFILFLILAIRVYFLPNSGAGYEFLFTPNWEQLGHIETWVMAMGQAFFSLSITGSGMIVYGTYLPKTEDIPKASIRTTFFNTIAALLAAFAIIPAVFAFNIAPNAGPTLMFITLPNIFAQMPFGQLFAILFFVSVAFAGITSLLNMFEAVSESWQTRFNLSRKTAVTLCSIIALFIGVFIEAEPKFGPWMDIVTIYIVPFGAVLGAFSIYYILGYKEIRQELELARKPLGAYFGITAKYIYVPLTIIIFVLGIIYGGI